MKLANKVAIVTGAASGIGRATALSLAKEGADVALIDLNKAGAIDAADVVKALGRRAVALEADIGDSSAVRRTVRETLDSLGRIDILVNNAGFISNEPFMEMPEERWDRTHAVNLKAAFIYMQEVGRHMIERGGGGKIVSVSSSSAFRAKIAPVAYATSKLGLVGLTRIAAAELAPHDINVNAVAPGPTLTGMFKERDQEALRRTFSEGPLENLLGRPSLPEDIAAVIVFLCLPASRQITGQTINVSAGAIV